jgi:hypothetical protein
MAAEGVPDGKAGSHGQGAHSVHFLLLVCSFPELSYYGRAYVPFFQSIYGCVRVYFVYELKILMVTHKGETADCLRIS